jgi:D-glycero-alpha-D-manno-heptose-7-phosphate kinase
MDDIRVHPVDISPDRLAWFEQHLMMFYTGIRRRASEVAGRQIQRIGQNTETLHAMRRMVDEAYDCLTGGGLHRFGELLDESWRKKQSLDEGVSSPAIAELYRAGCEAGALGGKLLGAGGGGFLMFFVPPERQPSVIRRLSGLECIPVSINSAGSHVLHESVETPKYAGAIVQTAAQA